MKDKIKNLRVEIDGLLQLTKGLNPINGELNTPELIRCEESLLLAKAWLGKILEEMGEENPYKNDGKRKTVEDIEPTADKAYTQVVNEKGDFISGLVLREKWNAKTHIEKVDWLRQKIQDISFQVEDIMSGFKIMDKIKVKHSRELLNLYTEEGYKELCKSRFWLGFELGRVKKEEE